MSVSDDITRLVSTVENQERDTMSLPKIKDSFDKFIKADTTICNPEASVAAVNEFTPEVAKTSVEVSISPTSAAVMQSLFYKEMMLKPDEEEDSSTTDSTCESLHDEDCSCQEQDTSSESGEIDFGNPLPTSNSEEVFKSLDLSDFLETESKDTVGKDEDEFSNTQEDASIEDMPKEDVIMNILSQLDPLAVDQVQTKSAEMVQDEHAEEENGPKEDQVELQGMAQEEPEEAQEEPEVAQEEPEEAQEEPEEAQEEVEEAREEPEGAREEFKEVCEEHEDTLQSAEEAQIPRPQETLAAAEYLIDLNVKQVVEAAVQYVVAHEDSDQQSQQSVVLVDQTGKAVVIQLAEAEKENEVDEDVIEVPISVPPTPAELQARAMHCISALEPLFTNDDWIPREKPLRDVRQMLADVGICATQLLMDTLNANPSLYHFRKEESWHGKNAMIKKGLHGTLARIGLINPLSENYRLVYNNLQRFSGTYLFVRHAVDHGNFTDDRLESLRRKGEYLLMNNNQNLEKKRCMAIRDNKLKNSEVPMCCEPVRQVPWLLEAATFRQNNPMPLSPKVLNLQKPKHVSPRKRASGSKENACGEPEPKRFAFDDSALQMACFGLQRL